MDQQKRDEALKIISMALSEAIDLIYGENMGFCLLTFQFNTEGVSDYTSNADRKDMIQALRETANRLEENEDIPTPIGRA